MTNSSGKKANVLSTIIKNNKKKIVIIFLILATIFRVILAINTPFQIINAPYDDTLFFDLSKNLREGHWLGAYTYLTLAKNTTFPIFLALCNFLMIPYSLALILVNIVSIVLLCIALKPKINNKYLLILYLLLLFTPFLFVESISQRLYRNDLLPAGSLLVFASFIGTYFRRHYPTKKLIPWCVACSASLIPFWHIKEDSIWILPFICILSILCIFHWLKNKKTINVILVIVPFLLLACFNTVYKAINYKTYGVYTITDRSSGNFAKMSKNLLNINDDDISDPRIWISKNMLEKAFAASPTFSNLKKPLENSSSWTEPNGEVRGDWIIWKIRTAMSDEGYYENAKKADEFCKNVSEELEAAFKNGSLEKDNLLHFSSMMKGVTINDMGTTLQTQFNWFVALSVYSNTGLGITADPANTNLSIDIQNYTNSAVAFPISKPNKAVNYSNKIIKIYQLASVVIDIISLLSLLAMFSNIIHQIIHKNYKNVDLLFVITGIGLSIILVLSEIALFVPAFLDNNVEGNPLNIFYCAPILLLMEVFKYLPIFFTIQHLELRRSNNSNKRMTKNKAKALSAH